MSRRRSRREWGRHRLTEPWARRVVANPPYVGAGDLLDRLLAPGSRLVQADLVLQHQLARRLVGRSRRHRLEVVARLPRSAFVPPPRVDSVVPRIRRR
ncbi:hypothetical protein G5V58_24520 [Nocardioides anomalus]|uniref:Ribosomal RNA adenine methylase transferase N-terminal domain-containing protein n=1 Tax=Nocardioides anomalus TaxID=2712223 RepID=A0A6G6WJH9_9ACTN|nr:rRNA adenine N-6-methyltransferase family protein [Nocardioides anomalus]QIG45488.1 hypothetical protein G5V58_24520 [Nocardioides anomalus]